MQALQSKTKVIVKLTAGSDFPNVFSRDQNENRGQVLVLMLCKQPRFVIEEKIKQQRTDYLKIAYSITEMLCAGT